MRVTRPLISRLDPWVPPIALMAVIFLLAGIAAALPARRA